MPEPERIDRRRAALIAYDVCRRALAPPDPARRAAMRPVLDAWVRMIAAARAAGVPVIYTTPVSRADGADVVMLPTDLSAETGVPPLTNAIEGTAEAGFPDEIAPRPEDYVFLKRRPSAFYGTGVAELLHMLRRDTIIIGGGATNRGVETSVREAFNLRPRRCRGARMLLERRCGRPRLQPRQGDENVRAHPNASTRSRRCCGNEGQGGFDVTAPSSRRFQNNPYPDGGVAAGEVARATRPDEQDRPLGSSWPLCLRHEPVSR